MAATNVLKFPGGKTEKNLKDAPCKVSAPEIRGDSPHPLKRMIRGAVTVVWFVVSLIWPLLRWILALDVVFQLVRMFWYWETPGVNAGWTFLLHFFVLVAMTYFVSARGLPKSKKT